MEEELNQETEPSRDLAEIMEEETNTSKDSAEAMEGELNQVETQLRLWKRNRTK